ncbi:hypothetical protein MNBD_ALPHA12-1280 [hydrothermal vent metagenome]|uniref:Demethylmenaquinone methyltransferase-like protein n=1 Tax=hydrothermal vent metagenome TaxID=652676 RepID=A0A3B0TRU1_9ZZZZ
MAMLKSAQLDKYSPEPASDLDQDTGNAKARPKSAEMSGGPGFRVRTSIKRPARNLVELFRPYESADVSDLLNRMFTLSSEIRNLANDKPLLGPAITVKLFPGDNLMLHKALDVAQPGDVVVVDTSGSSSNAVFGDLIANKARHCGIAGFVIDGLIRDIEGVKEVGLPVYARGITSFGPLHRGPGELNYPISCAGVVVNPGDIVTADQSGVVIVRREFASDLLGRLVSHKAQMASYVAAVKRGEFSNAWVDKQLEQGGCFFE